MPRQFPEMAQREPGLLEALSRKAPGGSRSKPGKQQGRDGKQRLLDLANNTSALDNRSTSALPKAGAGVLQTTTCWHIFRNCRIKESCDACGASFNRWTGNRPQPESKRAFVRTEPFPVEVDWAQNHSVHHHHCYCPLRTAWWRTPRSSCSAANSLRKPNKSSSSQEE
jgi:hypothetical protein